MLPVKMTRRFDERDWDAFAGAEKFSDGSEPFIAEVEYRDVAATIITDATATTVYLLDAGGNELGTWLWNGSQKIGLSETVNEGIAFGVIGKLKLFYVAGDSTAMAAGLVHRTLLPIGFKKIA